VGHRTTCAIYTLAPRDQRASPNHPEAVVCDRVRFRRTRDGGGCRYPAAAAAFAAVTIRSCVSSG
jgi:hypothetical protein